LEVSIPFIGYVISQASRKQRGFNEEDLSYKVGLLKALVKQLELAGTRFQTQESTSALYILKSHSLLSG